MSHAAALWCEIRFISALFYFITFVLTLLSTSSSRAAFPFLNHHLPGAFTCRVRPPNAARGNISSHYVVETIEEVEDKINELNGISFNAVLKAGSREIDYTNKG